MPPPYTYVYDRTLRCNCFGSKMTNKSECRQLISLSELVQGLHKIGQALWNYPSSVFLPLIVDIIEGLRIEPYLVLS